MSNQQIHVNLPVRNLAAGGSAPRAPQDHGFMYQHSFEDLDGHLWELAYMESTPPSEGQ